MITSHIKDARQRRGLSQEQLAELAGVSVKTISALEADPSGVAFRTIVETARILNAPIDSLFRIDDSDDPSRQAIIAFNAIRLFMRLCYAGTASAHAAEIAASTCTSPAVRDGLLRMKSLIYDQGETVGEALAKAHVPGVGHPLIDVVEGMVLVGSIGGPEWNDVLDSLNPAK